MTDVNDVTTEVDGAREKAVKGFCAEMSASMSRKSGESSFQKEALAKLVEDWEGLDKKVMRKLAKTYHAQNFKNMVDEGDAFQTEYVKYFPEAI
jgi:hypothetical protein